MPAALAQSAAAVLSASKSSAMALRNPKKIAPGRLSMGTFSPTSDIVEQEQEQVRAKAHAS